MQVVCCLVGFNADERRLHFVDGEKEIVELYIVQRIDKDLPAAREPVLPEWPAATDLILPEPRLRFMDAERTETAERRAELLGIEPLLVNAVPRFVEDAEERFVEETGIVARGDPTIAGADAGTKWVSRFVEAAGGEVEANSGGGRGADYFLQIGREIAMQNLGLRLVR